ncbi:hypothetical protein ACFFRR_007103 [Megaselia abdita]
MPPLYKMDNFDKCFLETNPTYCLIRADFIPDESSELWNQINDFSSSLGHFRHNEMTVGMCVSTCQDLVDRTFKASLFYTGTLTDQPLVHFQTKKVFKSSDVFRRKYNKLLNICINIYTSKKYNLKVKSNLLYCDNTVDIGKLEQPTDYWNLTFFVITGIITFMTVLASISRIDSRIIYSFSLSKNWHRLIKADSSDLRFLFALKCFIQMGVIFSHSVWGVILSPISNPEFFEQKSYWSILTINGPTILSSLYVFSIFFLTIKFLNHMRSENPLKPVKLFLTTMILRFYRLSFLYGFMILFQGLNIWPNGISPLFKFHIHREMWGCRESWWTNLLYVNNWFKMSENVSFLFTLNKYIIFTYFLVYDARVVFGQ